MLGVQRKQSFRQAPTDEFRSPSLPSLPSVLMQASSLGLTSGEDLWDSDSR